METFKSIVNKEPAQCKEKKKIAYVNHQISNASESTVAIFTNDGCVGNSPMKPAKAVSNSSTNYHGEGSVDSMFLQ